MICIGLKTVGIITLAVELFGQFESDEAHRPINTQRRKYEHEGLLTSLVE